MKKEREISENGNKIIAKGPKLGVVIAIVVIIAAILLGMQVYASTNGYGNLFFMLKTITTGEAHGKDEIFYDNDKKVNTIVNETTNTTSTKTNLEGVWVDKREGENFYHESTIKITNQTTNSIDFEISAVHGKDVDNVNIGEVKGTAKKVNDEYIFEEKNDDFESKITIYLGNFEGTDAIVIKEKYSTENNPYAGHNVWFEGEYEKATQTTQAKETTVKLEGKYVYNFKQIVGDEWFVFEGNTVTQFAGDFDKGTYTISGNKVIIELTDNVDMNGNVIQKLNTPEKIELTIVDENKLSSESGANYVKETTKEETNASAKVSSSSDAESERAKIKEKNIK